LTQIKAICGHLPSPAEDQLEARLMIKTVLVPTSGSDTDFVVFETALAAARPFRAHLEFFHVHVHSTAALRHTPHASFVAGAALRNALQGLLEETHSRSEAAQAHFRKFCEHHKISIVDGPDTFEMVSASWHEEEGCGDPGETFMTRARVHDLLVMGRFTRANGLPPDLIRRLLVGCGRPILIASARAPATLTETVMVCWKDAREPARALAAAMPLLTEAERVIVATVDEGRSPASDAAAVVHQLGWHGILAEAQTIKADGRPIAASLSSAAAAYNANLLVMGSYSTGPTRQAIFGGCTQSILEHADVPVFMLH
jgi:nucleotide-binding universal stress UspA family protein